MHGAINCKNLVFGCPRNRIVNDIEKDYKIASEFFKEIGDYCLSKDVYFAIEPNPEIYNTNFIITTLEAINLVKELNNPGIRINLDMGTMIQNNEEINILEDNINLINHVHISEPNLEYIKPRPIHSKLIKLLKANKYNGYISIEMKNQNNIQAIKNVIDYVKKLIQEET